MQPMEWKNAFLLATNLCEQKLGIKLPMRLLYQYWSRQVSVTEFKDVDVAVLFAQSAWWPKAGSTKPKIDEFKWFLLWQTTS